jgi:hypothetical protein
VSVSRFITNCLKPFHVLLVFIGQLFEEYKLVRRTGMLLCLVSNVAILLLMAISMLNDKPVSDNVRLVLLAILGLNSVYIGFYQWDRMQDRTE